MGAGIHELRAWAEREFGAAPLGDARRTRRLLDVACAIGHHPQGVLASSFSTYADVKAAYRLFDAAPVSFAAVGATHWQNTARRCRAPGAYLLPEDTTTLDFTSHAAAEGLGPVGDTHGRGLLLHSTLALRIEAWTPDGKPEVSVQGLLHQQCWARQDPPLKRRETRAQRAQRPRESARWASAYSGREALPPGVSWTLLADREGDVYETLLRSLDFQADFIVRAYQARSVEGVDGGLFEAVAQAPIQGGLDVALRARPGQAARTARMVLRAAAVTLRPPYRPGRRLEALRVNVVEAFEASPPKGVAGLRWVLLTSWPVDDFERTMRVVHAYTRRWLVEEFHKALKSGAHVEKIQLQERERIEPLVALLSVVAVRLLSAKTMSEAQREELLRPEDADPAMLAILEHQGGKPAAGWTYGALILAIASLGGFIPHNKKPGWQVLWRGWSRLLPLMQGYELALALKKCVP